MLFYHSVPARTEDIIRMLDINDMHTYKPLALYPRKADASQIFLRDTHVLPRLRPRLLVSYEKYSRRDRW
jgi:hypothetical protein